MCPRCDALDQRLATKERRSKSRERRARGRRQERSPPRRSRLGPGQGVPSQGGRGEQHPCANQHRDHDRRQGVPPARRSRPVHIGGNIIARLVRARESHLFGRGRCAASNLVARAPAIRYRPASARDRPRFQRDGRISVRPDPCPSLGQRYSRPPPIMSTTVCTFASASLSSDFACRSSRSGLTLGLSGMPTSVSASC